MVQPLNPIIPPPPGHEPATCTWKGQAGYIRLDARPWWRRLWAWLRREPYQPETDWNNRHNWENGRKPFAGDSILIPAGSVLASTDLTDLGFVDSLVILADSPQNPTRIGHSAPPTP